MFFFFFEQIDIFVDKMFKYLNIEYQKEAKVEKMKVDYTIKDNKGLNILVEVKETRNNSVHNIVSSGINQIRNYKDKKSSSDLSKYSFLILFGNVDQYQKDYYKNENIIIIDISNILYLIRENYKLVEELKNILPYSIINILPQEIDLFKYINYEEDIEKNILSVSNSNEKTKIIINNEDDFNNKSEENHVDILKKELMELPKGKKGSKKFEILGEKIIKFLFGDYFYDWKSQVMCNDNKNIMDLIGKVKKQEGFWNMLYEIYKSRYIVFEFKNYNEKLTQYQISDASKYLYYNALRTVAIIISREGANKNAKSVCEGILRESGKLILVLSENDLLNMLESKRINPNENLSSEYIERIFDDFLIGLGK